MKCVILDGVTVSGNDLNWAVFTSLGKLAYHPRSLPEQIIPNIGSAEIVLTSKCVIDRSVMEACPKLKYIGVFATGFNNIDIYAAQERGIAVTNVPAYSMNSVAQLTFALLLEMTNHVQEHNEAVHRGDWAKSADFSFALTPQIELSGKTMGIIGYGAIGKRVAQIARAFGMRVLVNTNHPPQDARIGKRISFVGKEELFEKSDVISLHCPLTKDNKHLINLSTIRFMKDGVMLLNTSRGPLVDEFDLAVALKSGKIAAAGIDVLEQEPPDKHNPLAVLDNCIITPHIAWRSKNSRERLINTTYLNLEAYLKGLILNRIV
ncbi:MAG: D-2-hydroxyacid dehydrogenase [Clostridiales Family XIII bacterium]|jgi:glycerate dehydrogenase|nr:D-2-hydroxyacid dehydrogenase [Clostridiales Family XIII bacterium]